MFVAPVPYPQIHPGEVNPFDLLLVVGVRDVEALSKSNSEGLLRLLARVLAKNDVSRVIAGAGESTDAIWLLVATTLAIGEDAMHARF